MVMHCLPRMVRTLLSSHLSPNLGLSVSVFHLPYKRQENNGSLAFFFETFETIFLWNLAVMKSLHLAFPKMSLLHYFVFTL